MYLLLYFFTNILLFIEFHSSYGNYVFLHEPRATQIRQSILDRGITFLKIADNIYKRGRGV